MGKEKTIILKIDRTVDENIKPENIKAGINILGVDGAFGTRLQEKNVLPKETEQTITADEGYDGLSKVTVGSSEGIPLSVVKALVSRGVSSSEDFSIDVPANYFDSRMTNIPQYLFNSNKFIKRVEIPPYITRINDYAFTNCGRLTDFNIQKRDTNLVIGADMFRGTAIEEIHLDNVSTIGNNAFYSSTNIKKIYFDSSLTSIGGSSFSGCNNLVFVSIKDIASWVNVSLNANTANPVYITKKLYLGEELITEVNLPEGVTTIRPYTLGYLSTVTKMVFPSTLSSIYTSAFSSSNLCTLFDFRKATSVPSLLNTGAFSSTSATKKIVVPDALYDEWIASTNWNSTTNNIVTSIIKASDYTE